MPSMQISYSNTIFYLKLVLFFAGLIAIVLIFMSAKKIELSTEVPFAKEEKSTHLILKLLSPGTSIVFLKFLILLFILTMFDINS